MKKNTENQKRENPMFEFDWIMSGVDALLEGANNELIQQRKESGKTTHPFTCSKSQQSYIPN